MIGYSKETKEGAGVEGETPFKMPTNKLFTFFGRILALLLPCYFPSLNRPYICIHVLGPAHFSGFSFGIWRGQRHSIDNEWEDLTVPTRAKTIYVGYSQQLL